MKKTTKPKKIEKIIHIHAKCNAFEIHENLPQEKALSKLLSIKDMFLWSKKKPGYEFDKLSVKTGVFNPTLF